MVFFHSVGDGGLHGHGSIQKCLVYFTENAMKMDENWGYPYFRKPPGVYIIVITNNYMYWFKLVITLELIKKIIVIT